MTQGQWPFPGDAPVTRARKMCLAYRSITQSDEELVALAVSILATTDRRLIAFDSPTTGQLIDEFLKLAAERTGHLDLDNRFREWGETFHDDRPLQYTAESMVTSKEASTITQLAAGSIGRLRMSGRIKGVWDPSIVPKGGWRYKVADLWELSSQRRGRGWRAKDSTDTLPGNGSSDPA